LTTLLGESRQFQARIKSIDLMDSLIVLKRIITDSHERVPGDQEGKPA
jgi:hypothetical protein